MSFSNPMKNRGKKAEEEAKKPLDQEAPEAAAAEAVAETPTVKQQALATKFKGALDGSAQVRDERRKRSAGRRPKNRVPANRETMLTIYMSKETQKPVRDRAYAQDTTISTIIEDTVEAVLLMDEGVQKKFWEEATRRKSYRILSDALKLYYREQREKAKGDLPPADTD